MHINFFTERCTPAWVHWFLSGDQQEPFKRILQGPKHSAKLFVFAILYCYWNITTMIECIKVFFFFPLSLPALGYLMNHRFHSTYGGCMILNQRNKQQQHCIRIQVKPSSLLHIWSSEMCDRMQGFRQWFDKHAHGLNVNTRTFISPETAERLKRRKIKYFSGKLSASDSLIISV